ncbi:MAG: hypothetical protein ABJI69_09080 [Balneola sp.]
MYKNHRTENLESDFISATLQPDPWWEFDLFLSEQLFQLRLVALSCNGFITGNKRPPNLNQIELLMAKNLSSYFDRHFWDADREFFPIPNSIILNS